MRDRLRIGTDGPSRPTRTTLVAVATTGDGMINQHFGRATEFWVYEAGPGWARLVQTRSVERYCSGPLGCTEDERAIDRIVRLLSDCSAVVCAAIGPHPLEALEAAGIQAITTDEQVEVAVARVGAQLVGGMPMAATEVSSQ